MKILSWTFFIILAITITANLVFMPVEFRSEIIPKVGECVVKIDMLEERVGKLEEHKTEGKHKHKFLFFRIK